MGIRYTFNNIGFIVGKNAEDNWSIIKQSESDNFWVHAHGIPSTHVIIEIDKPNEEEIQYACNLCKLHTKITNNKIRYIVTRVDNIKLGSKPGEVYFKKEEECSYHTIIV
jgi:predicted ribosome quality control (RQC) complex YloA/Tae2 family protein